MNHKITDKINDLLSEIEASNSHEKENILDTLSSYLETSLIDIECKNKIINSVIELFSMNNNYSVQESIFYILSLASQNDIMQDSIIEIMLNYLSSPRPEFIQYAIDTLTALDLSLARKNKLKELVEQCLNSKDLEIKKVMIAIIEDYKKSKIPIY